MCDALIRGQEMPAKKACALMSAAPYLEPMRLRSSLVRSFRIRLLHADEMAGWSGNTTGFSKMLLNVARRSGPLNGVRPNWRQRTLKIMD